ncbi:MAG: hypothetical protein U0X73_00780 [Thermoanaerobaculia bacterium]
MSATRARGIALSSLTLGLAAVLAAPLAAAGREGPGVAPRRMFVTSTQGSANLGSWAETTGTGLAGLPAGDKICQVRAEAVGFATAGVPVFRAWISDSSTDAWCHVQGLAGKKGTGCGGGSQIGGGPWKRADDVLFSQSLADFTANAPLTAPVVTETNAVAALGPGIAWSGTNSDGTLTADTCGGWTVATFGAQGIGATTSIATWTQGFTNGCGNSYRLYCFEQGAVGAPVSPVTGPGGIAFVTSESNTGDLSLWASSGSQDGLAGGDAVCQTLAAAATLPGASTFKAWMSDAATDAISRLTLDGPWNRVDGLRVASSKADLTDGNVAAPLRVTETGSRLALGEKTWTGTSAGGTKLGARCADWTSGLAIDSGAVGLDDDTNGNWTSQNFDACDQVRHLDCFGNVLYLFWDNFEAGSFIRWTATSP